MGDAVGDAGPTAIALDANSLAPVASFSHLGSPNALVARGGRAWYLGAREAEFRVAGGPRQRAVIWSGGPSLDLLELDAASGEAIRLCQPGGSQIALDEDGIWVSGRTDDPMDQPGVNLEIATGTDPVTSIQRCDLAGNWLASIRMAGQADEMVACGGQLWVSGFLRSRQARVLSVLDASGGQAGEADLDGVDITPWYTEPEPEPQYSPREFAERARAVAEEALTKPPGGARPIRRSLAGIAARSLLQPGAGRVPVIAGRLCAHGAVQVGWRGRATRLRLAVAAAGRLADYTCRGWPGGLHLPGGKPEAQRPWAGHRGPRVAARSHLAAVGLKSQPPG